MKRTFLLLAVFGLALASTVGIGCRNSSKDKAAEKTASGAAPLKVALMTPGPVSDDGWNAAAYAGLQLIQSELGAEVAHKESTNEGEFKQDFRDFARRGYDLVFAHGFEFSNAARDVSSEFPKTYFVTTGGLPESARPNYSPAVFVLDEGAYLLGVLAGKMTKTNKLGVIGGQELPPVVAAFSAFEQGAKSVNPKAQVVSAYVGNWSDAAKAREQAAAQIKEGADFLFQNADKAGLGVFQAVKEARDRKVNVYAFGSNSDQNHIEPTAIIASAISEIPKAFAAIAKSVQDGTFQGKLVEYRIKDGWVSIIYNPQLEAVIPQETKDAVETARQAFLTGTLQLSPH